MTHVTIFINEDKDCVGFQIEDHAGYADQGEDVVCAAISMLVINTMNSIEAFTEDEFSGMSDEESAMISFHLTQNPSKEAGLLLNSMILGLQNMVDDDNYAEYIDLTFEEV